MNVGLLWHDDSQKPLEQIVAQAAQRYRERFGRDPNVCYVHPSDMPADAVGENIEMQVELRGCLTVETADGVKVQLQPSPRILRFHYWIGVDHVNESDRPDGVTEPEPATATVAEH